MFSASFFFPFKGARSATAVQFTWIWFIFKENKKLPSDHKTELPTTDRRTAFKQDHKRPSSPASAAQPDCCSGHLAVDFLVLSPGLNTQHCATTLCNLVRILHLRRNLPRLATQSARRRAGSRTRAAERTMETEPYGPTASSGFELDPQKALKIGWRLDDERN